MKNHSFIFFVFLMLTGLFLKAYAQNYKMSEMEIEILKNKLVDSTTNTPLLNPRELDDFKVATENKVNELQNNITVMANKQNSDELRIKAKKSALKLFIPKAKMSVSDMKRNTIKIYPMPDYFIRLMSLPYTKVIINFYDIAYISNFYMGLDGKYHATATIFQEFKAFKDNEIVYTDRIKKNIDIILDYKVDELFGGKRWIVQLGNIQVVEAG